MNNINQIKSLTGISTTADIIRDVRSILEEARRVSVRAVNNTMVFSYWLIGKRIVIEEQQGEERAAYGEQILKNLSRELTQEFGEGFSYANLKNMRKFYQTYPEEKGYTLCSQLPWSHNRLIMRVADAAAREWYLREAAEQQWTVRQLERNIHSFYYQRMLEAGKTNVVHTCSESVSTIDTRTFVKDPYVLEFVGLPPYPQHREKPLEDALMDNMQQFLLELGKGFSFVKRQYRIATESSEFYIDLVFYNYILKCFVLVDLKAAKLTHQDVGQMDMYIRMFDDLKRGDGDNPTIGILMCAEKDETVVKYSVLEGSKQIFASKYLPYLPSEEEIRRELEKRPALENSVEE